MTHFRLSLTLTAALVLAVVGGVMSQAFASTATDTRPQQRWKVATIKTMVAQEARNIGLPVALALAVAKVESDFRPHLESNKGARGVMQIMPATALDEYAIPAKMLWNPRINIRLGLHFLQRLLVRYRGRIDLALSYYNGGSRVGDLPNARVMPATRGYVKKVRSWQQQYQRQVWMNGAQWKSSKRPGTSWKRERVLN
ncbi:MAG: lytic transglycosylase domain-containing protein [Alphaproteobacteria bacterium]|jgi:soluble lytic murein transglycosylase-like protein|nr:lytic transglycosylase domain-containing protein [Alphaproteobacteria bacterium]MBT4017177.1 lytic transglycosylase domain-containing protein [Alphaproteobacteria bacterium]MBT4966263.1 lytic transglycosylase domain-containing protein [Alphaproteobacteria bacterium]MBT5917109.1 lytic transglycosylase domain-containing protein [Alphaproteobacteria bacterium]MBT6384777.1 lytic transglycosylase domain-containing protein [Alphaproteobacteria bacterium]